MSGNMSEAGKEKEIARAELLISLLLRSGVIVCGAVIALGLLSRMIQSGSPGSESSSSLIASLLAGKVIPGFHPAASAAELFQGIMRGQADSIITAGLLLLIGLPILRVALTIFVFLREKDWPFVAITVLVLSVLLSGIFLGQAL
jgi:uncharacterized membrane protein